MHLVRVANALDRARFLPEFAVVFPGGTYEKLLSPDIPVHAVSELVKLKSSTVRKALSVPSLAALIRRRKPDIICSGNDDTNIAAVLATKLSFSGAKTVLTVQAPPSIVHKLTGRVAKGVMLPLIKAVFPQATQVVSISKGVDRDLTTLVPKLRNRTKVIYNACLDARMDTIEVGPTPSRREGEPFKLIACGRLVDQKGFEYLLDAVPLIRAQVPLTLTILGEGPLRPKLEARIRELGLQGIVTMPGFVENPFQLMAKADAFVLSSVFEGLGMVLVEAMACGTAVISTRCPYGPEEIVDDGKSGLLVPVRDPSAMADAVVRIARDDDLRVRLGRAARIRSGDFSPAVVTRQYEDIFESIL
ncbi:MAG: glycosyltransferase [Deltaproteobacteria bacterium]|nr:glycosyltransferase [Deltaproteobacteria bacterium]